MGRGGTGPITSCIKSINIWVFGCEQNHTKSLFFQGLSRKGDQFQVDLHDIKKMRKNEKSEMLFLPATYIAVLKYRGKDHLALFGENYCRIIGAIS